MFVRKINTIWIVATVTPAALGSAYTLSHDGQLTLSGNMSTDLEGSLIGDWEADTNPDGTQTLPGGSTRNPKQLQFNREHPGSPREGTLDWLL